MLFCFVPSLEDNDADGEIEDLIAYFEQQLTLESSFPKICTPEFEMTQVHISGKNLSFNCIEFIEAQPFQ